MPEIVSIADGDELAFRAKQVWLLLRALGGKVRISDEEWEQVPDAPDLILDRKDGVMTWTAMEPASPVVADLDPPEMPGQMPLPGVNP